MAEIAEWARQRPSGVRLEWGSAGAAALGPECACVVVVDVLSFTTSVSVAVEAGTRVLPYPSREGGAAQFAARHGAELAVGRRAVSERQPWSLSPAALRSASVVERLVLPSPNGSAIAAAVSGVPVVAACLRNAGAVAGWIAGRGWGTERQPVALIAAGEQWPGRDVLRPAVEDWLGAGAVAAALARGGAGPLSAEAHAAAVAYDGIADVAALIRDCASGRELSEGGFAQDVAVATELDSSGVVPVLIDGAFVDAAR
ncbi:2-phosphosulfolactate phosphatase [Nocardia beijingensis]|uniref:2-phosphosulfolactate phosphatase n=1 Tax=Nocardia beijingensis TaxID=95162 RepID=UPI000832B363|nr:2-phosphosulfolactate phosphatase [Nocardia beijingensis]